MMTADRDLEYLHKRLDDLVKLEAGWLNGDGLASDKTLYERVRLIVSDVVLHHDVDPKDIYLYPTPEGGLSWEMDWFDNHNIPVVPVVSVDLRFHLDGTVDAARMYFWGKGCVKSSAERLVREGKLQEQNTNLKDVDTTFEWGSSTIGRDLAEFINGSKITHAKH